jgi:ankyrin repeat protein
MNRREIRTHQRNFMKAADQGNLELLKSTWEIAGNYININHQNIGDDEFSALHNACLNNRTECVAFLLEKGADPNVIDEYGETPLFCAMEGGNMKCMRLLVESNIDINHQNNRGQTILHRAISFFNDSENIEENFKKSPLPLFIGFGASLDIQDKEERTPLDLIENEVFLKLVSDEGDKYLSSFVKEPE